MVLILRIGAVFLALSIIFFAARKAMSPDRTASVASTSIRSVLGALLATLLAMVSFVVVAEIITRM